mgnify:CR=1 FL=1
MTPTRKKRQIQKVKTKAIFPIFKVVGSQMKISQTKQQLVKRELKIKRTIRRNSYNKVS